VIAPLPGSGPAADAAPVSLEDPLANPRIRALAMDIAFRLRPLCGDLSEGELVRLVTRVALIQQSTSANSAPTVRRLA
jgi:hypothetical protein